MYTIASDKLGYFNKNNADKGSNFFRRGEVVVLGVGSSDEANVSGSRKNIKITTRPPIIERIQKIHLHPK